jgi:protein-tyrosine phosphatase
MRSKLYPIDGPWPGRLAILPRPRGGDWLEDEVAGWRKAGVQVVVSALTPDEIESMDLGQEQAAAERQGLAFIRFPIPDRGTPDSFAASEAVFRQLDKLLNEGKEVGVHCRQGIGRSALIAATLLVLAGVAPPEAWQRIESTRGCPVPDTLEQRTWVERFTRNVLADTGGE